MTRMPLKPAFMGHSFNGPGERKTNFLINPGCLMTYVRQENSDFAACVTSMEAWHAADCISHSLYLSRRNYIIQHCDNQVKSRNPVWSSPSLPIFISFPVPFIPGASATSFLSCALPPLWKDPWSRKLKWSRLSFV